MYTTKKYIADESHIHLSDIFDDDLKSLQIWIGPEDRPTKFKVKEYHFGSGGKIKSLRRNDDQWTAYPPLNYDKNSTNKPPDFHFEDSLYWNEKNQLVELSLTNLKNGNLETRFYEYENNLLSRIKSNVFEKKFEYNSYFQIENVDTIQNLNPIINHKWRKRFFRNSFGNISRRTNEIYFESQDSTPGIILDEIFDYNEFGQISTSKIIGQSDDPNEPNTESTSKFNYLNSNSDKIKSIIQINSEKLQTEWHYKYDAQENLIECKSCNFKEEPTITSYIRINRF